MYFRSSRASVSGMVLPRRHAYLDLSIQYHTYSSASWLKLLAPNFVRHEGRMQ